jgi:hypothetical protein
MLQFLNMNWKMDPRFKPIAIEITIFLIVFTVLIGGRNNYGDFTEGLIKKNMDSGWYLLLLFVFAAELVRITWKLRKLRKQGVNIDDEAMKSHNPDMTNPEKNEIEYINAKKSQPIYKIMTWMFVGCAAIMIFFWVMLIGTALYNIFLK